MITAEQIYDATDRGFRILELHIPDLREAMQQNKHVKIRNEKTASAKVRLYTNKKGLTYYGITDFGDDSKMASPIQFHMNETGLSFPEAVLDLAQIFNISDTLTRFLNKPDIHQEPAPADLPDGHDFFELLDDFTDEMCRVMGPNVTREHLKALHWLPVKFIGRVKDRKITYRASNDHFPIFMRECWFVGSDGVPDRFYKIYEPLNPDKGFRFSYMPRGKKQADYINGLQELLDAHKRMNDAEEAAWNKDPGNENKPYREKKLPAAVICSGERDSLCARSQGYYPLWLNSETAELKPTAYNEIKKLVEVIYNIPDIDETGIRRGTELALKYLDIHTVWLPRDYLSKYKDNRGKTRKDLRDWMELRPSANEFKKLINCAAPATFWSLKDEVTKSGAIRHKYSIDFVCVKNFLNLNGFYTLKTENKKEPVTFIRITGNIVEIVTPREIRAFVEKWAEDEGLPRELRNVIASTQYLNAASLESLKAVNPDFTNYSADAQWFFFEKFALEVKADNIIKHDAKSSISRYVWRENVINHEVRLLDDMFKVTYPETPTRGEDFDIVVNDHGSNFFRYLINSSRIYWRKELESNLEGLPDDRAEEYRQMHRFDIAGENLTEEEVREQKLCLISKIFTIGYMMHRYKSQSRAWAPFVMDNRISENGKSNGGSGKSFMFKALSQLCSYEELNGRNRKLLENQFWTERISKYVDIVLFDDIDEYFPVDELYNVISGDISVNQKYVSGSKLKYEDAPKFAFTTNYVPSEFSDSTTRRMIYIVTSDYYHVKGIENNYRETRPISADFGKDLFAYDYTAQEWEADINFIMQCVRFYLSVEKFGVKIMPKLDNIIFRKHLRAMSDNFREWAEQYFAEGGDHLDVEIVRQDAFEDYKRYSGTTRTTMQGFTKALYGFCYTCDYIHELNPADRCNSGAGKRILKRITIPGTTLLRQTDMIYLRTKREEERLRSQAATAAAASKTPVEQPELFDSDDEAPF